MIDNTIKKVVVPRQRELGSVFERYQEAVNGLKTKLDKLEYELETLSTTLLSLTDEKEKEAVQGRIEFIKKSIFFKKNQIAQKNEELSFLSRTALDTQSPEELTYYIIYYTFVNIDISIVYSDEEIAKRSKEQLTDKCNSFISALKRARVNGKIITDENKVIDFCRKYTHPYTADMYRTTQLKNRHDTSIMIKGDKEIIDLFSLERNF